LREPGRLPYNGLLPFPRTPRGHGRPQGDS
jgi:hypothetical protein